MDTQDLSFVTTFRGNQAAAVNDTSRLQAHRGCFSFLPPEIWQMVANNLDSFGDISRLSRVNKHLFSLLIFTRAQVEAKIPNRLRARMPSMLYLAIKRKWSLGEIEKIVAAYTQTGSCALETNEIPSWEPPLHLAVKLNRLDVVDLLLQSECCKEDVKSCKNALDIAREAENSGMEDHLLVLGAEDLGRHEPVMEWCQIDPYEVCLEW
ncbi:hypothetical protein NUW58_g1898 [Xylaria curta]|uniref:Uncharacterized protein n=1 Tax=Xylaria curta TaxID=42375 RepID=A0ACC1PI65_9PEZI|nr:hypothetical protein NUW58_g1898 [Xylaria curta]